MRVGGEAQDARAGDEGEPQGAAADDLASLLEVLGLREHLLEPAVGMRGGQVVDPEHRPVTSRLAVELAAVPLDGTEQALFELYVRAEAQELLGLLHVGNAKLDVRENPNRRIQWAICSR